MAVLAALATPMTGCYDGDGIVLDAPSGAAPAELEAPSSQPSSENADQRGIPASEVDAADDVAEPTIAETGPSTASPRGATASAPAEGASTIEDDREVSDTVVVPVERPTLQTSGRRLLDTCGKPFVTRGVEQIFGEQLPQGNDWAGLLEEIALSGVNAVRVLVSTDTLGTDDIDDLLNVVAEHDLVAYVTPYGNEGMRWLEGQDVRAMLAKHEKYILIDAFGEPTFDDRERFLNDSIEAIQEVRSWGYRVPLTVTANQFGRDLPSVLELGAQIVAADPLHNTVLGWQAYWSQTGYYQDHYGLSLTEAVDAISKAPFPIQLGLDRITDFPSSDTADYGTLMAETAAQGIGWLWWDWYNPYGNENNLTENGSAGELTATGDAVIKSHPASVAKTSERVCVR